MKITAEGFGALADALLRLADKHCKGGILLALEGGYNLQGLSEGGKEVLFQLSGQKKLPDIPADASADTQRELNPIFEHLQRFYSVTP
jgi:acetoin utilization deacetylase AcuC-like enzyme